MTHPQTQDDEALVEVVRSALHASLESNGGSPLIMWSDGSEDPLPLDDMVAAVATALRNHEGRK